MAPRFLMAASRLITAAYLCYAVSAAPAAVAWRAAAANGAALEVYSDDTYALLAPGGAAWLASAPTAVHIGGAWFAAAAPPAPSLLYAGGFLAAGGDVRVAAPGSISLALAQAWCLANSSCAGLTYEGGEGEVPPSSNIYFKATVSSGVTPSSNWSSYIRAPLPLTRLGAGPSNDGSGGYEIRYSANGSTPLVTSFALNATSGAFVFTQRFPLGATGVATQTPVNSTSGARAAAPGEFASSTLPATQFPVFAQAAGVDAADLGFVSWSGRFFSSLGAGGGGAAAAFTAAAVGAEGGPIVLFAGGSGAAGDALVLSALDNFKSTMLGSAASGANGQAAAGVSGYVASLPVNFSTSTIALFGAAGVTDAMHLWGAALRERHGGAAKLADPASEQLTCKYARRPSARPSRQPTAHTLLPLKFQIGRTTGPSMTSTHTSPTSRARACRRTCSRRSRRPFRTERTRGPRSPSRC